MAVAALRCRTRRPVTADDHAAALRVWSRRHRDLGRAKNQVACRLHAVLCELVPGGVPEEITAAQAARILRSATPSGAAGQARGQLAAELLADMRRLDAQIRASKKKLAAAVPVMPRPASARSGRCAATARLGSQPRRPWSPRSRCPTPESSRRDRSCLLARVS